MSDGPAPDRGQLEDAVFFPAQGGKINPVVDRATWTVSATPDDGRTIGGSQMAHDEQSIYVVADKRDVLVSDADTYEMTDSIEPLSIIGGANARTSTPDALWVTTGDTGMLQRIDIPVVQRERHHRSFDRLGAG